jgi:diguanylate cyclase (GGDEF)-like protein
VGTTAATAPTYETAPDWRSRLALLGRTAAPVAGLDDRRFLRRVFVSAIALWAVGIVPFLTIVSQTQAVTAVTVGAYVSGGFLIRLGMHIAARTERMPGFLLLGIIIWVSALGAVSEFYYEMTAVTTVALCTAFVSWLGTRFAPLYGLATVSGVFAAGIAQGDSGFVDRTVVVTLAVAFAVTIVGRSSDASRLAHEDREVLMHRLAHESRHDELTGVGNRKLLIEKVQFALASPNDDAIALALVDLDDFKTVNDTQGHAVGDLVLQSVASRLKRAVGDGAFVTRVGGDEFAVLFTDGTDDTSRLVAVLEGACNHEIEVNGRTIPVRASVGVVAAPRRAASLKRLLAAADEAMYGTKRASRAQRVDGIL